MDNYSYRTGQKVRILEREAFAEIVGTIDTLWPAGEHSVCALCGVEEVWAKVLFEDGRSLRLCACQIDLVR